MKSWCKKLLTAGLIFMTAVAALRNAQNKTQADSKRDIQIGDTVRIKGLTTVGKIENITGDTHFS